MYIDEIKFYGGLRNLLRKVYMFSRDIRIEFGSTRVNSRLINESHVRH